jgi:hypothetical protein
MKLNILILFFIDEFINQKNKINILLMYYKIPQNVFNIFNIFI